MVNDANRIEGRKISAHPFADVDGVEIVEVQPKGTSEVTYLAGRALIGGVLLGKKGMQRFQAGDYILTGKPATEAWVLNEQVFAATLRPATDPKSKTPSKTIPKAIANSERKADAQRKAAPKAKTTQRVTKRAAKPKAAPKEASHE